MKKTLLILLAFLFAFPASASTIQEGAIVKTANNPDVYIIKYANGKQYRRLVLNPKVFESYGHLKWGNILTISDEEMLSFRISSLVKMDGYDDVYDLTPSGDAGEKYRLVSTLKQDLDSIYIINSIDFFNYIDKGIRFENDIEIEEDDNDDDVKSSKTEEDKRIEAAQDVMEKLENIIDKKEIRIDNIEKEMRGIKKKIASTDTIGATEKETLQEKYDMDTGLIPPIEAEITELKIVYNEVKNFKLYKTELSAKTRVYIDDLGISFDY